MAMVIGILVGMVCVGLAMAGYWIVEGDERPEALAVGMIGLLLFYVGGFGAAVAFALS